MLRGLVNARKVSRAKRMSSRVVLEFKIVQRNPIIAFVILQGSMRDPYIVILDAEKKIIGHSCPDFLKRRTWCKHIAKLLLMIPQGSLDFIARHKRKFGYVLDYQKLNSMLLDYKEIILRKEKDVSTSNLQDKIKIVARSLQNGRDAQDLLESVISELQRQINPKNNFLRFYRINSYLEIMKKYDCEILLEKTREMVRQAIYIGYERFIETFWSRGVVKRLEIAYLIFRINNKFRLMPKITDLHVPKNVSQNELADAYIILEVLFGTETERLKVICTRNKISPPNSLILKRLHRIYDSIIMRKPSVEGLDEWVVKRIKKPQSRVNDKKTYVDDFLIYLMESNEERPHFTFDFGNYSTSNKFQTISEELIQKFPCLSFVLNRIKESEREYITKREYDYHETFFKWLEGKKIIHNWTERPRRQDIEPTFLDKVQIIQWDIDATEKEQEFLCAFDGEKKIIIEPTSIFKQQIQPFDYTMISTTKRYADDYRCFVEPLQILTPIQVIKFVIQGIPIVSNILPWNVLEKYSRLEKLSDKEIGRGIDMCRRYKFIYGSIALAKVLEGLRGIGVEGLTKAEYEEIHKKLKILSPRRINDAGELIRKIVDLEGNDLKNLLEKTNIEIKDFILLYHASTGSPTLTEFRKYICREIMTPIVKKRILTQNDVEFFLNTTELGLYRDLTKVFINHLRGELIEIEKLFQGNQQGLKSKIRKLVIGNMIFKDTGIKEKGRFPENDKQIFLKRVKMLLNLMG